MTTTSAAPVPVPDLSFLSGLEPGVAYAALATIVIVMSLIYLGPGIRDRLRPRPPSAVEPAPPTSPQTPTVVAAVQQADELADRFIAHLRVQVDDLTRENADLGRAVDRLRTERDRERAESARLQSELDRLTWRRGAP